MTTRVAPATAVPWAFAAGAAASLALRPSVGLVLVVGAALGLGLLALAGRLVALAAVVAAAGLAIGVWRLDALAADPLGAAVGTSLEAEATVTGDWRGPAPRWSAEATVAPDGARVLLRLVAARPPPRGAILAVSGDLERPDPPRNGYDEAGLLARHGIRVVLEAERWHQAGSRGGVAGALDRIRQSSLGAFAGAGRDDAGVLLGGLVLGADESLSRGARDDFRSSGLAHLLAVSGSNVALLAVLVLVLAWVAGLGRAPAVGATILVIAGYVGVVGPSPSVVRAGVAGGLAAAAWLLSRPVDRWHLFAVGLAVLLGRNPYDALDPGFQLSFAAVGAIFLLAPRLTRWLEGTPVPLVLVVPVSISAACTLATAPIAWWHFGQANVVASVPANVLAAPAVPPILWLGVLAAALEPVLPVAAYGCAAVARYPCLYLLEVARLGAWLDARLTPHALTAVLVAGGVGLGWAALRPRRG